MASFERKEGVSLLLALRNNLIGSEDHSTMVVFLITALTQDRYLLVLYQANSKTIGVLRH